MIFNEPQHTQRSQNGWIEVICGPMFSGKTEELLRRLRRAKIANIPLAIFKPQIDTRYAEMRIVSHDANYFPSLPLKNASDILKHRGNAQLVAIDEAQFFDEELLPVLETLATEGVRIIAAGLDMDYLGKPFGIMPQILSVADYITKLNAICMICGAQATHSYRKSASTETVQLGEKDIYEPRCRKCFHNAEQTIFLED